MASQPLAALDSAPGDAMMDPTAGECLTTAAVVVGLVGVELRGPFPRSSPALADGWDGIHDRLQHPAVVNVGACQLQRGRDALRGSKDVTLRARLAPIRWVRAGRQAPFMDGPPLTGLRCLASRVAAMRKGEGR